MGGYAIRNDLQGWRGVDGPDDVGEGEHYSKDQPAIVSPSAQDIANAKALAYLSDTDWYVIRHQETGDAIPADVLSRRVAAREAVVR